MGYIKKSGRLSKKSGVINKKANSGEMSANNKWLTLTVFVAVGILIFYPPFFRGVFFGREVFITHTVTALVFILSWVNKIRQKDYRLIQTPLDWAVAAYAAAYLLSVIGAIHIGEAVYGFLRVLNYFMVYWLVNSVVKDYGDYENILRILLAGAVSVAVIGILAALGYYNYPSAFTNGVINSTLQYPNTLGAYLSALSLIGIVLWIRERRLIGKLIYGMVVYCLLLVVLATVSKGAWLVLAIGAILLFAGLFGNRMDCFYNLGLALTAAALAAVKFIPAITAGNNHEALMGLFIGIVVVILGQGLWLGLDYIKEKKGLIPVVLIISVLAVAGVFGASRIADKEVFIPAELLNEASRLKNLEDSSFTSRYDFYTAALDIIKDNPFNGAGAGGWNALYHQYMKTLTWAADLHNHFLQVWVEAGTLGILAFLSMWLLALFTVGKLYMLKYKQEEFTSQWLLIWGTAAAALCLGMHAFIDFDLTYMAISIILWSLFALLNSAYTNEKDFNIAYKPVINITVAAVLGLTLLGWGASSTLAYNYAYKGYISLQAMSNSDSEQRNIQFHNMLRYYEKAVEFDSLNAEYQADLANGYAIAYASAKSNQPNESAAFFKQKSLEAINKAERLKPYDIRIINSLIESSIKLGDIEGMCRLVQQGVKANPSDKNAYDSAGIILWNAVNYYMQTGANDQAREKAEQIIGLYDKITHQLDKVDLTRIWQGEKLYLSGNLSVTIAKSYYLLGDYTGAQNLLSELAQQENKKFLPSNIKEMYAWYAASLYRLGQESEAGAIVNKHLNDSQNRALYHKVLEMPVLN